MTRRRKPGKPRGASVMLSGAMAGHKDVEITMAAAQALGWILRHLEQHGFPPTTRELAEAMGMRSAYSIRYHLLALSKAGLLIRRERISRGLVVTRLGRSLAEHWGIGA